MKQFGFLCREVNRLATFRNPRLREVHDHVAEVKSRHRRQLVFVHAAKHRVESAETRNWNSSHHFVLGAPEYTGNTQWGWLGPMAVNHGNSSVLGFCDGHSEVRRWRDRFNIERVDKLIT